MATNAGIKYRTAFGRKVSILLVILNVYFFKDNYIYSV